MNTFKDIFIKQLQDNKFEFDTEKEGIFDFVDLLDAESGESVNTFVFNSDGDLDDIWNNSKEQLADYKKEMSEKEIFIKKGEAITIIASLFNKKSSDGGGE